MLDDKLLHLKFIMYKGWKFYMSIDRGWKW